MKMKKIMNKNKNNAMWTSAVITHILDMSWHIHIKHDKNDG